MVRWPAARQAANVRRNYPKLSLGLHVDLGEWIYKDGEWVKQYEVMSDSDLKSAEKVSAELWRQVNSFRRLVADANPTHLDSHQHVHQSESLRAVFAEVAAKL